MANENFLVAQSLFSTQDSKFVSLLERMEILTQKNQELNLSSVKSVMIRSAVEDYYAAKFTAYSNEYSVVK